jgi:hypothetical protein
VAGGFGVVGVFAAGAVESYGFEVGDVAEAHWEERVGVAHDARAFPELGLLVLVELLSRSQYRAYLEYLRDP